MGTISPIVLKQRQLYLTEHPLARAAALRRRMNLGALGAANASVWSGPPVGEGAGKGAAVGATQGAALGTQIMPVIGTAIGAIVGAIGGAIAGSLHKKDPENANFDQAVAMWSANRLSVLNIADKYLPLAGLFDLNIKTNIPIYKKYGRMGEQRFVMDMMTRVYQAAQSGQITAADTAQSVMVKVVQPWIDSWGFGPMADPHADLINVLLMGMIADYVAGKQRSWLARGGDYPFASLPVFSLPDGGNIAATGAPTFATSSLTSTPVTPSSARPQYPGSPAQVLEADGSQATLPGVGLKNRQGLVFQLGPQVPGDPRNTNGYPIWVNGSQANGGFAVGLLLANNGETYHMNAPRAWYQWNGNAGWVGMSGPPAGLAASTPTVSNTTIAIPAGFALAGAANGLQAYQGADGGFYSWSGSTMSPLTGTLVTLTGQTVPVTRGVVQANTPGALLPYAAETPVSNGVSFSAPSPTPTAGASIAPSAAGVTGESLPPWLTWGAIAAGVALMFATARPMPAARPARSPYRRSRA